MNKLLTNSSDASLKENNLRAGFIQLCKELLDGIIEVFPECSACKQAKEVFQLVIVGDADIEDKFIRKCQSNFNEQISLLEAKNPEGIFRILESTDVLKDIDIRSKWNDSDFDAESQESFWKFITTLNTYGKLYTSVPLSTMNKIDKMAHEVGRKMKSGDIDFSKIGLEEFGKDLLSSMSEEELHQFEENLPEIYSSISTVMKNVSNGSEGIDVASLMAQVTSLQSNNKASTGSLCEKHSADVSNLQLASILQIFQQTMQANSKDGNGSLDLENFLSNLPLQLPVENGAPKRRRTQ